MVVGLLAASAGNKGLKTYSEKTTRVDEWETRLRAGRNEVCEFVSDSDIDAARGASATVIRTGYTILRQQAVGGTPVADWEAYATAAGVDPEDGFIHTLGVRNTINDAGDWYVMNCANETYQRWCAQHVVAMALGAFWSVGGDATLPLEGVLIDVTHWPWWSDVIDPTTTGIFGSDEYGTTPLNADHPIARGAIDIVVQSGSALASRGLDSWAYGNVGSVYELSQHRVAVERLMNVTQWLLAQICYSCTGADVELQFSHVVDRIADINHATKTKDVRLLCTFYDPSKVKPALAAALFALADNERLYGRYAYALEYANTHVDNIEDNTMLRALDLLGAPRGEYATAGRLLSRQFERGTAYAYMKNSKADASDSHDVDVPDGAHELLTDGTTAPVASPITLWANDGVIVFDTNPAHRYTVEAYAGDEVQGNIGAAQVGAMLPSWVVGHLAQANVEAFAEPGQVVGYAMTDGLAGMVATGQLAGAVADAMMTGQVPGDLHGAVEQGEVEGTLDRDFVTIALHNFEFTLISRTVCRIDYDTVDPTTCQVYWRADDTQAAWAVAHSFSGAHTNHAHQLSPGFVSGTWYHIKIRITFPNGQTHWWPNDDVNNTGYRRFKTATAIDPGDPGEDF